MSVLPLKADIRQREWHVRYVPEADIRHHFAASFLHGCGTSGRGTAPAKKAKVSPVIVYSAQASYEEGLYYKHGCNIYRTAGIEKETQMAKEFEEFQKAGEQFQKVGKDSFDAAVKSLGEVNKGLQAIAAEVTDYSKKAVEDSMRAFEQLMGAKSLDQAIEIQSRYTKQAYDTYMAEMTKLGEMYVGLAKNAYKPVESALTKKTV